MQLAQQIKVNIRHKNHFRVRSRFGTLSVGRESKVTRCKHTRLGILDVHVVHARQIAHAAGNHDKAFVLDGAGLSADTHTRISVLCIGKERNKQNLHALVGHQTRKFGELHIITDKHANLRAVRIKSLHTLASAQAPALHFVGSDVNHLVCSVAAAKETNIIKPVILLHIRHASGNDIDIVLDGQRDKTVAHFLRVLSQSAYRLRFAQVVELGHQRSVEIFGEKHEIALIARNRINEEFNLLEHIVKRLV